MLDPRPPHRLDVQHRAVDLMDGDRLTRETRGLDALFHLAAYADVNDVVRDPAGAVDLNVGGTIRALEAAKANNIGRFILASSVWVYSSHKPSSPDATVDEESLISIDANRHVYTSTKLAAEMLCHDYWNMHGVPFTILRYGIPYGPRMRPSLVMPIFVRKAIDGEPLTVTGDGSSTASSSTCEDLAPRSRPCPRSGRPQPDLQPGRQRRRSPSCASLETVTRLTGSERARSSSSRPGPATTAASTSPARKRASSWAGEPRHHVRRWHEGDRGLARGQAGWRGPREPDDDDCARALRRARERPKPRRVAVMPAYNEEATIVAVLERLAPLADELIVVDDGSVDHTRDLLVAWSIGRLERAPHLLHRRTAACRRPTTAPSRRSPAASTWENSAPTTSS